MRFLQLILIVSLIHSRMYSQPCTLAGQTPGTAIAVCGNRTYTQSTLPPCTNRSIFVPGCTTERIGYGDTNPIYYRLHCLSTGTFVFKLTPLIPTDDYDWQLFDITGKAPSEIYRDKTLAITGNWSGTPGNTGTDPTGVTYIQCRSTANVEVRPTFCVPPVLQAGHDYLLLISHGYDLANGYVISFGGGTADITNTQSTSIKVGSTNCANNQLLLTLNQKVKCASIASDASDFSLVSVNNAITNVTGLGCASGETDSILLNFTNPLPDGNYELQITTGSDGNTILNGCNLPIPVGTRVPFTVTSYPAVDSIKPLGCGPDKITLLFDKKFDCSSVAVNGSDFSLNGPSSVTINNATVTCNATNTAQQVELQLSQKIEKGGVYTLTIKTGSDGNTITDNCGQSAPIGNSISFSVADTVNADFTYSIKSGCTQDSVFFIKDALNGIDSWTWVFDNLITKSDQNPVMAYTVGGNKTVKLSVTNGTCSAVSTQSFLISPKLKALFGAVPKLCPDEPLLITDSSLNATTWLWNFGNGITSNLPQPGIIKYPAIGSEKKYNLSLTVGNGVCTTTYSKIISVSANCKIAVPTAFSPDGNGINDYLEPLNIPSSANLEFIVYNRHGIQVFRSIGNGNRWNGTFKNEKQPTGIYIWLLKYIDPVSNKPLLLKGYSLLIR